MPAANSSADPSARPLGETLPGLVLRVPTSREPVAPSTAHAAERAHVPTLAASRRAAALSALGSSVVGPTVLLHCPFARGRRDAIGDLLERRGDRLVLRRMSSAALRPIADDIAGRMTRDAIARGAARFVPIAGSAAAASLAWRETGAVARNAIEVSTLAIEPGGELDPLADYEARRRSHAAPAAGTVRDA